MPVVNWTGHEVDVAVVGAGAAGLAAARRIADLRPDLSVLVLEAGGRTGGRAHTVLPRPDLPLDLGCGWLHGARDNAWTRIARELGVVVNETPAPWNGGGRELGLSEADRHDSDAATGRFFALADSYGEDRPDVPLSALLEPGGRWNALIGAIATYINGANLAEASVHDYGRYDPGPEPDWRVRDGYGRLIRRFGEAASVVTGAAVARIAYGGLGPVRLDTARGTLSARAAIVTVSTDVLAAEVIRFDPALPGKVEAAAGLPLGHVEKLFVTVADPGDLPVDGHCLGSPSRVATAAYQVRPFGRPVIECYFGGDLACDLGRQGVKAAFAFASEELAAQVGSSIRGRLAPGPMSAWDCAPWIRGAYSYARPGCSDGRAVLATPVGGRLFFAGEACSRHRYSTAHGAYETGVAAADALLAQAPVGRD